MFRRCLDVSFAKMQWFLESVKYDSRFVMIFSRLLMYVLGFLSLVWIPSIERVNFGLIFDYYFFAVIGATILEGKI
jgi:hypothetical protein